MKNNNPYLITFDKIGSPQLGYITIAEAQKNTPFDIKRVYWTYYTPQDITRGGHAHKKLNQVIFAVAGTITFNTEDKDGKTETFVLDHPNKGLFIPKLIWRDIQFSHNAVLLCLASELYDETDYFRSYEDFKFYKGQDHLHLVDYTESILEQSWNWLNDPEVKELTNTPDFTKESQKEWFNNLSHNESYFIRGISYNDKTIGVAGLKKIDRENSEAEYFGYIGEKEYWGKGLSNQILSEIVLLAKEKFGLNRLYLNVIPSNIRALRAYENFGFRIDHIDSNNVRMTKKL